MKSVASITFLILLAVNGLNAQTAPDAAELTKLLNEFLAATNDPAMHERFWADDLIYTRSAGRTVSKAEILRDVRSNPAPKPEDPKSVFTAEDIRIQQYNTVAIVAFRLVDTTNTGNEIQIAQFRNTGTFLKRNGKWQAVSWQATRIPRVEEDSKKEVTAAGTAFFQAVLNADTKTLSTLTTTSFIWTHTDGHQLTRQELLAQLSEGRLKYSKLETSKVIVNVYGDTAIVRGESLRQRIANPDIPGKGDAEPFTAFYTITFVNQGAGWKAVAMHTSRKS